MQEVRNEKLVVVKHNDLIDAAQRLTTFESRIILTCIAMIDSKVVLDSSRKFELSAEDISDVVGLNKKQAYEQLKEAVYRLYQREVILQRPSKRVVETHIRWVSQVSYIPDEGKIELYFTPGIAKLLGSIDSNFTQYKLDNVLRLKNSYSFRIYELLCKNREGVVTFTVEEFKRLLDVEDCYDRWNNFKARVLDASVSDLNTKTNMTLSYELVKRGRGIQAIKFNYSLKGGEIAKSKPTPLTGNRIFGVKRKDIEMLARPGEDWFIAAQRIKKEQAALRDAGQPTLDIRW
jgi:plasmid replication initiation protein